MFAAYLSPERVSVKSDEETRARPFI